MGLKQDLIDAKKEGLKLSGAKEEAIEQAGEALEVQAQLEVDAIVNFLTKAKFRVTQLNANVVLEDFKIPPQQADILTQVKTAQGQPVTVAGSVGSTTGPGMLQGGTGGVRTKQMNIGKSSGGLQSTGYVFIGPDPNSQENFDVNDRSGQMDYTTVELFKEDLEKDNLL